VTRNWASLRLSVNLGMLAAALGGSGCCSTVFWQLESGALRQIGRGGRCGFERARWQAATGSGNSGCPPARLGTAKVRAGAWARLGGRAFKLSHMAFSLLSGSDPRPGSEPSERQARPNPPGRAQSQPRCMPTTSRVYRCGSACQWRLQAQVGPTVGVTVSTRDPPRCSVAGVGFWSRRCDIVRHLAACSTSLP
jgi:hypothetical protein